MSDDRTFATQRLYLCTPDRPDLASFIAACISGGVDIVQLRAKDLDDQAVLRRARVAREVCSDLGATFILNDRPDLAVDAGADGAHIGQDDVAPVIAREILGPELLLGLSTHEPSELAGSAGQPIDYVSVGPVVETPTKPGRPGTGQHYVTLASKHSPWPFFVTGGVRPESVPALVHSGARRFVVVRYLTEASDPFGNARALKAAIDEAIERTIERTAAGSADGAHD